MAEDLGFSRSSLASIIAIGMLCYGLAMPLAGWLVGRIGTRHVLLLGTAILVASTLWAVNTRSAAGIFWSFGVWMSVGAAFTSPVALTGVISRSVQPPPRHGAVFLVYGFNGRHCRDDARFAVGRCSISAGSTPCWGLRPFLRLVTVPTALLVVRDNAPANADAPCPQPTVRPRCHGLHPWQI